MPNTQPALRAFTVIKRNGKEDYWLQIGAAFETTGDGYNVILQALPIADGDGQCKIVLRPPREEDRPSQEGGGNKTGLRRR